MRNGMRKTQQNKMQPDVGRHRGDISKPFVAVYGYSNIIMIKRQAPDHISAIKYDCCDFGSLETCDIDI